MKNTEADTVMSEMHAIKDANSARFGHNLKRMFAHWEEVGNRQCLERAACPSVPVRPGKVKPRLALGKRRVGAVKTRARA
jgi:hypothetical protein